MWCCPVTKLVQFTLRAYHFTTTWICTKQFTTHITAFSSMLWPEQYQPSYRQIKFKVTWQWCDTAFNAIPWPLSTVLICNLKTIILQKRVPVKRAWRGSYSFGFPGRDILMSLISSRAGLSSYTLHLKVEIEQRLLMCFEHYLNS
jgi:hypothetical protein